MIFKMLKPRPLDPKFSKWVEFHLKIRCDCLTNDEFMCYQMTEQEPIGHDKYCECDCHKEEK